MWADNETARDFLNFTGVSDTVAEIIVQANGRPISIGVSGAWGVGKSSMIKLIRTSLEHRDKGHPSKFVFVEFNAWLYQGYDDARAALMEVIATALADEANARKTALDKTKELLKRVDWFRTAKLAGTAAALFMGVPPIALAGEVLDIGKKLIAGEITGDELAKLESNVTQATAAAAGLLRPKVDSSPPKEIHAIRKCFEDALKEMRVTLVVLIDDLDRCLPPTTIATLEAIRLFLFLENTAFVIAADDAMIKHAVRKHFDGVDDKLVTNYFDKLIQVPIRVPPLGTQEVRAYMMLLFVENSTLAPEEKESIRARVCAQLAQTWRGRRVDRAFMETLHQNLPPELVARFDSADRLAPLMTTASQIAGNPRLIKRFLNALSIRMAIAKVHGVGIDEAALAKMLLFERCGEPAAYDALAKAVTEDEQGKPHFLTEWEEKAHTGQELELDAPWDSPFIREWLTVPPRLGDLDLRGILYVSREHGPLITPEDRLSSEAADVLVALLQNPDMAATLRDRMTRLSRPEMTVIMDRVLERARREQSWGTPPILDASIAVAAADPPQGKRVAAFLRERPSAQITPSLIPKIADEPWAGELLDAWKNSDVTAQVKRAITLRKKDGHVSV
ncbi:MAG: P-loop NTPase fold protein [Xanthobacteraceae bacterium]|jgi:predicted KAP-like P-loop ATPase